MTTTKSRCYSLLGDLCLLWLAWWVKAELLFTQTKFRIVMMTPIRSSFQDNKPKEGAVLSLAMEYRMTMPDLRFLLLLNPVHITHVVRE